MPAIGWTGWRGPNRDGRVTWLPDKLPAKFKSLWSMDCTSRTLGGVAATEDLVIYSDRNLDDSADIWKCVSTKDGKELWTVTYPAKGNLDYGNSPRATPLIHEDRVYLFGAFGHLTCAKLRTGETDWEMNFRDEFEIKEDPKWGACSNPMIADGKLILGINQTDHAIAALEPKTGKLLWKGLGKLAGYGSPNIARFGGKSQIIAHDSEQLLGYDLKTGKILWNIKPANANDFNVPTPVIAGEKLLIATENNGTRLFEFEDTGLIKPKPVAVNRKLAPDTHTPVVVGDRVFGIWRRLFCLNLKDDLKTIWESDNQAFTKYAAIVASESRVLVMTLEAEFILMDAKVDEYTELGRVKVLPNEKGLYSHPAFVGKRVYVRGGNSLSCLELGE